MALENDSFVSKMPQDVLDKYLSIPDLTDPANGTHAINLVIEKLQKSFRANYPPVQIRTSNRISNVIDEFDSLHIPLDSPQRSSEYVRYIDEFNLLRSHTTPLIPKILKEVKEKRPEDLLVFCPGICYLQVEASKQRISEPHKMDIWRIKKGKADQNALIDFVETILDALSPGTKYRTANTAHPYTKNGLIVEVETQPNSWLKLFECGQASDQLLIDAGLDSNEYFALGMGLGLEKCVMHIKKIDDIRLIRSEDPKMQTQMRNLEIYRHNEL